MKFYILSSLFAITILLSVGTIFCIVADESYDKMGYAFMILSPIVIILLLIYLCPALIIFIKYLSDKKISVFITILMLLPLLLLPFMIDAIHYSINKRVMDARRYASFEKDVEKDEKTEKLMFAGIDESVKLLKNGAEINRKISITVNEKRIKEITPLFYAIENGLFEKADFLIKNGAKIDDGFLYLCEQEPDYQRDIIKTAGDFLKYGADVNYLETCLSYGKDERLLNFLLKNGANVNPENAYSTPLSVAAKYYPSYIPILVKYGADINKQDEKDGRTILHMHKKNIVTLRIITAVGADVNIKDNDGDTPINWYWGAVGDNIYTIAELLNRGADINSQDNKGGTIFHKNSSYADAKEIELLIQLGADPSIKNNEGRTAYDIAEQYNNIEIRELLKVFKKQKPQSLAEIVNKFVNP
ncbi:MAG: hypothetical protein LBL61_02215, partial [Elusimicrobiota bacterium]|nr:hypothetical protein [Elusimicrobiota bacterium]